VPDWVELKQTHKTGHGLAWTFTVHTDKPGRYLTSVAFECDTGIGHCQISLEVREGRALLGDLVFCDSPFNCYTGHETLTPLVRILGALPLRTHCLSSLTDLGELQPRTIVLHRSGLLRCKPDDVDLLRRLAAAGVNLLVLADEFYRGTTGAANRVLAPFGLRMKQDGSEEPGLTREERLQRTLDWQARYERVPFDAGPGDISAHPLTQGVKRLHWDRPCPVVCASESGRPLVRNPAAGGECFAAVAAPGGYVVAVGKSLWCGLSGVGWPYDNDRFLANLLIGGDAEAAVAEPGAASGRAALREGTGHSTSLPDAQEAHITPAGKKLTRT
jgi:hypothetical protein